MKQISRTIDIPAAPATVWEVLTDTEAYGRWNPFIVRLLRWQGRLGVPRVFDGLHELGLEPTASGTRFVHSETFRGVLVPFLGTSLAATAAGFEAMNQALADECARTASSA